MIVSSYGKQNQKANRFYQIPNGHVSGTINVLQNAAFWKWLFVAYPDNPAKKDPEGPIRHDACPHKRPTVDSRRFLNRAASCGNRTNVKQLWGNNRFSFFDHVLAWHSRPWYTSRKPWEGRWWSWPDLFRRTSWARRLRRNWTVSGASRGISAPSPRPWTARNCIIERETPGTVMITVWAIFLPL